MNISLQFFNKRFRYKADDTLQQRNFSEDVPNKYKVQVNSWQAQDFDYHLSTYQDIKKSSTKL